MTIREENRRKKMGGVWGRNIKLSIFGESHGKGVGVIIDGLPSGIELDIEDIQFEMNRRRPGKDPFSTPRNETDKVEIMSGYFNDRTTGTPLCAFIANKDQRSKDYGKTKDLMRPGHADYTGYHRYSGFNDFRGGGHFSGRLTAPLVFAGALSKQILRQKGVIIGSHIYQIGTINDIPFDKVNIKAETLNDLRKKDFPVIDEEKGKKMKDMILEVKKEGDSIGGIIECAAINLPPGVGEPFFDSVESTLSHLLFSIPAVKGVEFGTGFDMAKMKGSKANDEYYIKNDVVKTYTNNNGGILGGITNGMPVIFKAAFKPTPSISKPQRTVDISIMENTEIQIEGRHDPCIVQRAIPVVEAATAIALLDHLVTDYKK
jgi:chorismate synthase